MLLPLRCGSEGRPSECVKAFVGCDHVLSIGRWGFRLSSGCSVLSWASMPCTCSRLLRRRVLEPREALAPSRLRALHFAQALGWWSDVQPLASSASSERSAWVQGGVVQRFDQVRRNSRPHVRKYKTRIRQKHRTLQRLRVLSSPYVPESLRLQIGPVVHPQRACPANRVRQDLVIANSNAKWAAVVIANTRYLGKRRTNNPWVALVISVVMLVGGTLERWLGHPSLLVEYATSYDTTAGVSA